jgi:hypothetical protein
LELNDFKKAALLVVDKKMLMYASISCCDGGGSYDERLGYDLGLSNQG